MMITAGNLKLLKIIKVLQIKNMQRRIVQSEFHKSRQINEHFYENGIKTMKAK